jgi:hypothetical protein
MWLKQNDERARRIARNGKRFASLHLHRQARLCYYRELFAEMSKLYRWGAGWSWQLAAGSPPGLAAGRARGSRALLARSQSLATTRQLLQPSTAATSAAPPLHCRYSVSCADRKMCVPLLDELLYLGHWTGVTCAVHEQLDAMHGRRLDKGSARESAFGEAGFMHGYSAISFDHWEGRGRPAGARPAGAGAAGAGAGAAAAAGSSSGAKG